MTTEQILERTIAAFNQRRFAEAANLAEQGCELALGRDELFWFGLAEPAVGRRTFNSFRDREAAAKW